MSDEIENTKPAARSATLLQRIRNKFRNDEDGATAVEYGIIVAFIAIALAAIGGTMVNAVNGFYTKIGTALNGITITPGNVSSTTTTSR